MSDDVKRPRIRFYHSVDLDGHCSGAIFQLVAKKLGWQNTKLVGYNYGQDIDVEALKGAEVYFIDCTPQPVSQWAPKIAAVADLFVIDHHVSAISDPAFKEFCTKGNSRVGTDAGCALAWEFWQDALGQMPEAVRLLSDYDAWNNKDKTYWEERVMPFQYGMKAFRTNPKDEDAVEVWGPLLNDKLKNSPLILAVIERGETIYDWERTRLAKSAKPNAFEAEVFGKRAIVLNTCTKASQAFEAVFNPEKHDVMVAFTVVARKDGRGLEYNVSFYATRPDVDCSMLAKRLGGGGHKGAAGCTVDQMVLS